MATLSTRRIRQSGILTAVDQGKQVTGKKNMKYQMVTEFKGATVARWRARSVVM